MMLFTYISWLIGASLVVVGVGGDSLDVEEPSSSSASCESDHSTLLSVTSSLAATVRKRADASERSHGDDSSPSSSTWLQLQGHSASLSEHSYERAHSYSSAKQSEAKAIIFVKMPKVGGETFAKTISQFARRKGLRTLQHKACKHLQEDPLGQATCACDEHYMKAEDLPPVPKSSNVSFSALYTHMHYNPNLLKKYFPEFASAAKLVLLRDPLDVLQSVHAMAAYQDVHDPEIKDNFCQDLAADGDLWRAKCPFVRAGQDSILDYLDEFANKELIQLFSKIESHYDLDLQASAIIEKATKLLEDEFIVGLQEEYDASMLLFEAALGWNRSDTLYSDLQNAHSYEGPEADKARASWLNGTALRQDIVDKLNRGPYYYYTMLYKRGVEVHRKQLKQMLGSEAEVAAAVDLYGRQNTAYSDCMSKCYHCVNSNSCGVYGLTVHTQHRPICAHEALANVSAS